MERIMTLRPVLSLIVTAITIYKQRSLAFSLKRCTGSKRWAHNCDNTVLKRRDIFRTENLVFASKGDGSSIEEEWSDFDLFSDGDKSISDEDDKFSPFYNLEQQKDQTAKSSLRAPLEDLDSRSSSIPSYLLEGDLSGCRQRLFSLGEDFILAQFIGSMGFDEVTDWEYFSTDEDTGDKQIVQPNPLDKSKPKRTRERIPSVVRVFRGEFIGSLSNAIRSQGLDNRILIKEFAGDMALSLASSELKSIGKLQSLLCSSEYDDAKDGNWARTASSRASMKRLDDVNVVNLLSLLRTEDAPQMGILGEVNLAELEDDDVDPNDWYRSLGVSPPKAGSVWIVYEYAGLSSLQQYSQPASLRLQSMRSAPGQESGGLFGSFIKPPTPTLPPWKDRARYVVQGVMYQTLKAVGKLHVNGIVHRSIGRTSVLLTTLAQDKTEASSPLSTVTSRLVIKLADFGFSGLINECTLDEDFTRRASSYKLYFKKGDISDERITNYAIAEDLHALGYVFLGLLLTSLAELPSPEYNMPSTDDETLQRQLDIIFHNDMDEFRDYVFSEDKIWTNLVKLLDENDKAGWELLKALCFARENVDSGKDFQTANDLLSSPFFRN